MPRGLGYNLLTIMQTTSRPRDGQLKVRVYLRIVLVNGLLNLWCLDLIPLMKRVSCVTSISV